MRITFILPMYLNVPSGGFKVVYEYANRLNRRGHRITVIHPRNVGALEGLAEQAKARLWRYKIRASNHPLIPWFKIDADVRLDLVTDLRERFIPAGDAIFATACETASPVFSYSSKKGRKFYLIQSYETWNGEEHSVQASWKLPLHKIAISRQLIRQADDLGESARTSYIPNGLDFSIFNLTIPIPDRASPRIGMLAHPNEAKGMKDGIQALQYVKGSVHDLQAVLFGTEPRCDDMPEWIEYVQRPSQRQLVELYNSCRIFLNPSWAEGWGLPASEAMACGCALVSADNGGVNEFAVDEENALVAPIKCPELLAEKMMRLLSDDALRIDLATAGHQSIQTFTWDRAVDSLEQILFQQVSRK
ncbi:MAG: glycosyltransferase family 4 protein [Acidobacteriota bacterium]